MLYFPRMYGTIHSDIFCFLRKWDWSWVARGTKVNNLSSSLACAAKEKFPSPFFTLPSFLCIQVLLSEACCSMWSSRHTSNAAQTSKVKVTKDSPTSLLNVFFKCAYKYTITRITMKIHTHIVFSVTYSFLLISHHANNGTYFVFRAATFAFFSLSDIG